MRITFPQPGQIPAHHCRARFLRPNAVARPLHEASLSAFRASSTRKISGVVPPGKIPRQKFAGTYWNHTIDLILQKTGAANYLDFQQGVEIVWGEYQLRDKLPIWHEKGGVKCDGHSGGLAYYVIRLVYRKGNREVPLVLGLDCAANVPAIPAKLPQSKEIKAAVEALSKQEQVVARLQLECAELTTDGPLRERFDKEWETLLELRDRLYGLFLRENRSQITSFNHEQFLKKGAVLRDRLFSLELRLARLEGRAPGIALTAAKMHHMLVSLESLAEGVRLNNVYLHDHLVAEFNAAYEKLVVTCPSLQEWAGLDQGMRTFERYVGYEGDDALAIKELGGPHEVFTRDEILFIRRSLAVWSRKVEDSKKDDLTVTDAAELRRLYNRMPARGFMTRHHLESEYPQLGDALAMAKEDVDFLPPRLRPMADKLRDFLEAFGTHEVIARHTPVERPTEERDEPAAKPRGRGKPVDKEEVDFFPKRRFVAEGEKVGRFTEKEVKEFAELSDWLRKNYRSKDEILSEFPEILKWIGVLKRDAPLVNAEPEELAAADLSEREKKAIVKLGRMLMDGATWTKVERKIAQFENMGPTEVFPRHAAEKFGHLATKDYAKRGVVFESLEGLKEWVDGLCFDPKERKYWRGPLKQHAEYFGKAVSEAFEGVELAFQAAAPKKPPALSFAIIEFKNLRLPPAVIEAIAVLERALDGRFKRLAKIEGTQRAGLANTLAGSCPDKIQRDQFSLANFLYNRGFYDPQSPLLKYVEERGFESADAHRTVGGRAEHKLPGLLALDLPLAKALQERAERALRNLKAGAVTAPQAAFLRELDAATNDQGVTTQGKWLIFRGYLERKPSPLYPERDKDLREFLREGCTAVDRAFIAGQIHALLRAAMLEKKDDRLMPHYMARLADVRAAARTSERRFLTIDPEVRDAVMKFVLQLVIGSTRKSGVDFNALELESHMVSLITNLAHFIPAAERATREVLVDLLIPGFSDSFVVGFKSERDDRVSQLTVASFRSLMEEDAAWRPLIEPRLRAATQYPQQRSPMFYAAIQTGATRALSALGFPAPAAPPAAPGKPDPLLAISNRLQRPSEAGKNAALADIRQLETLALESLADERRLRQIADAFTLALGFIWRERDKDTFNQEVRYEANAALKRLFQGQRQALSRPFTAALKAGEQSARRPIKIGSERVLLELRLN